MTEHELHILQRSKKLFYRNHLAYLKTKQGAFEASMLHLDHPFAVGCRELTASDEGRNALQIRENNEVCPLWLKLWRNAYAKLPLKGKRVLMALAVDWRSNTAAKIAGVSRNTVKVWKTKFKTHFAQCHTAWKRDLVN